MAFGKVGDVVARDGNDFAVRDDDTTRRRCHLEGLFQSGSDGVFAHFVDEGVAWVAVVKPGRVMFEMAGIALDIAKEALRLASHKLPVKCKIVVKETAPVAAEGGEEQ